MKITKIFIITLLVVAIIITSMFIPAQILSGGFSLAPNETQIGKFVDDNFSVLSQVSGEMEKLNYSNISISKADKDSTMYATNALLGNIGAEMTIPDVELIRNLKELYSKGIRSVSKYGIYIEFSKWSTLNESRGILYIRDSENLSSENLNKELSNEYIIDIKPLSKKDWYFYESNFEKYKSLNSQQKTNNILER